MQARVAQHGEERVAFEGLRRLVEPEPAQLDGRRVPCATDPKIRHRQVKCRNGCGESKGSAHMSTSSASAVVEPVLLSHGARTIIGTRVCSSKFAILQYIACSPSAQPLREDEWSAHRGLRPQTQA